MKIAIIDCFSGISGDMTLGALLDWGVPLKYIRDHLNCLNLKHFKLIVEKTKRNHISATKIQVEFDEKKQPHRKYTDIEKLIKESDLQTSIKTKSLKAFKILGEAEAKIHATTLDKIHFHEVGAIDSIVDLVGSIIGFEYLKVDKIYSNPVPLGSGFTKTAHGIMPVPAPAALEILRDYQIVHRDSGYEMTTPTGATLIKVLVEGVMPQNIPYVQEKNGFGAGTIESNKWPNLLRLITGTVQDYSEIESLVMIETNIDDMNPEIYPYLIERLYKLDVKDVFLTQVIMKKGRPGTQLSVLTDEKNIEKIENKIFAETTTIGIRKYIVKRRVLERENKKVKSKFGEIDVKLVKINGKKFIRPEYEQCKKIAKKLNISLQEVYREIERLNK